MKWTRLEFLTALTTLTVMPWKLLASGITTKSLVDQPPPAWTVDPGLEQWLKLHWVPVTQSDDAVARWFIAASMRNERVHFRYWGGSTPGAERTVSLALVFQAGGNGPLYVSGSCHLREQERVFRLDRLELCHVIDGAGGVLLVE